mmetsp:Transcript_20346/g.36515  ORF Transcript_20346/g.36515 Transcript_20346/m.36515 type:complete len:103 (+) Transcript_20346:169-477(+)
MGMEVGQLDKFGPRTWTVWTKIRQLYGTAIFQGRFKKESLLALGTFVRLTRLENAYGTRSYNRSSYDYEPSYMGGAEESHRRSQYSCGARNVSMMIVSSDST